MVNEASDGLPAEDGVYLVGSYLGLRDGKPRTFAGREVRNCDVGIRLEGGPIETISYGSRKYAEEAAGALTKGDRAAFRVEVKNGVGKDGRPWMFYASPRTAGSDTFADEFAD